MKHAVLSVLIAASSLACATAAPQTSGNSASKEPTKEEGVLVGDVTREQIEEAVPDWAQVEADSAPDPATCQGLTAVEPGADVTVFLGTWCGDSRREVPRLWKALDLAGPAVPFEIHYVGVDRDKKEPGGRPAGDDIRYVPTFIVRRNGQEVGRIVEHSPAGIEKDLLALLTGQAHGLITSRSDLR
ncbi:MAG TPA: thioredoxin family protein [Thermoanaerobaculia bacterium]|jgi:thiol-disulfide isomerase/thioredoxin|nr:thioredoxin family protein [Thermoanaerobaculia bacterium]